MECTRVCKIEMYCTYIRLHTRLISEKKVRTCLLKVIFFSLQKTLIFWYHYYSCVTYKYFLELHFFFLFQPTCMLSNIHREEHTTYSVLLKWSCLHRSVWHFLTPQLISICWPKLHDDLIKVIANGTNMANVDHAAIAKSTTHIHTQKKLHRKGFCERGKGVLALGDKSNKKASSFVQLHRKVGGATK